MTINIIKNENDVTIKLVGRLDTNTSPALDKCINEEVKGVTNLTIDLGDVEYVSSAGLRVLLSTQKKFDKGLKIKNVQESVMEVFEITGFCDILNIE
ncbi:MAG: STAS domain-containing protein [Clostridia bacterium]|nr:STAS domain-containing protein [Clostridia bacterium]